MAITTVFDLTNPLNYTLSNIDIAGDVASIALSANAGQAFSQAFTSASGFTYNPALTQIAGGVLSQINQAAANLLVYASWTSLLNANYGTGSLAVTSFEGAAIAAGVLNLTGSVQKHISLSPAYSILQQGTIAFQVIPNYTGAPGANQIFFNMSSSAANAAVFYHMPSGQLHLTIYSSTSTSIVNANLGAWSPVSGTTYTFVVQIDTLTGASKVFINGVQFGGTQVGTGARTQADTFFIGADSVPADGNSNFSIKSLAVYSAVVTPGSATPLSETNYTADLISLPVFSYSGVGVLQAFTNLTNASEANSPRYILNGKYWSGSAWVASSGSYAEASSKANVVANIATLPASDTLLVQIATATNASLPMSINGPLAVTYTGQHYGTGTLLSNSGILAQTILTFSAVLAASGLDSVTFALQVNGQLKYHNGTSWVDSNGALAQSNTASQINAYCEALLSVNSTVKIYAVLTSNNGLTTPSLTSMTFGYDFGQIPPAAPITTVVYGFLNDITGNPVANALVTFTLVNVVQNAYMETTSRVLIGSSVVATTDANGYFEQAVLATTQFQGSNTYIQVTIQKGTVLQKVNSAGRPLYITVPEQATVDITSLLSA